MSPLEKLISILHLILEELEQGIVDYQLAKEKLKDAIQEYQKAILLLNHPFLVSDMSHLKQSPEE